MEINVKDARNRLSSLLDQVEEGDEVTIFRHGKEVARLVPPRCKGRLLPSLKDFRSSIDVKGKPLSSVVVQGRDEGRY